MYDVTDEMIVERISPEIDGADEAEDIIITQSAIDAIRQIREQNKVPDNFYIRLAVAGGGCSGVNYQIGFDSNITDDDWTYEAIKNVPLVIDRRNMFYIMGVTLDFISGDEGSGFVFKSPHNAHTCGCSH